MLPLVLNQVKVLITSFSVQVEPVVSTALASLEDLLSWAFLQDDSLRLAQERMQSTPSHESPDPDSLSLDDHVLASGLAKQTALTSDTSIPEASFVPVLLTSLESGTAFVGIANVAPHILFSPDLLALLAESYLVILRNASSGQRGPLIESLIHRNRVCILLAQVLVPQALDGHASSTSVLETLALHKRLGTQLTLWCKQVELVDPEGLAVTTLPGLHVAGDAEQYGAHLLFLVRTAFVVVQVVPAWLLSATLAPASGGTDQLVAFLHSLAHLSRAVFSYAFGSESLSLTAQRDREQVDNQREEVLNQLLATWMALSHALNCETSKVLAAEDPDDPFQAPVTPLDGISASASSLRVAVNMVHTVVQNEVVQPYVRGRLSSAAWAVSMEAQDGMSEKGEEATNDRELFEDQLTSLGLLARTDALSSLSLLAEYLSGCLGALDAAQAGQDLDSTWEQLNWLLLIAGHFLADAGQGETPAPPPEISDKLPPRVGPGREYAAAGQAALGTLLADVGTARLLSFTQRPEGQVSPLVLETWLWLTGRWATPYLFSSIAGGALAAESGAAIFHSLIQAISLAIRTWSSDADVVTEAAACIKSFQLSEALPGKFLADEESTSALFSAILESLDVLPAGAHGKLIAAAVGLIFSGPRSAAPQAEIAFMRLTGYISARFEALIHPSSLAVSAGGQPGSYAVTELQKSLDMLQGLGASIQPRSARTIFGFAQPFFPTLNQLCVTFRSHPPVVLAILRIYLTLATTLEYTDDDAADAEIIPALAEGVWGFFQVLSTDEETLRLLAKEDPDADKPFAMLEEALQIVPTLAQGVAASQASPTASSQDYLLPPFTSATDASGQGLASVTQLSSNRLEDVTLMAFATLAKLVRSDALAQAPTLGAMFAAACAGVVRIGTKRLLTLILGSGDGLDLLAGVAEAMAMALAVEDSSSVLAILEAVQSFATTAGNVLPLSLTSIGDRVETLGQVRLVLHRLMAHLLTTILYSPLDHGVMDDYLKALYSLLLIFSKESLGGEGALLETLQDFASNRPAFSQEHASGPLSNEVVGAVEQIFIGQQQHRAETYLSASRSSTGSPFRSGHAGSGSGSSNFLRLQSRMRIQASRKAQEGFVKAVRPAIDRARAGVLVR